MEIIMGIIMEMGMEIIMEVGISLRDLKVVLRSFVAITHRMARYWLTEPTMAKWFYGTKQCR